MAAESGEYGSDWVFWFLAPPRHRPLGADSPALSDLRTQWNDEVSTFCWARTVSEVSPVRVGGENGDKNSTDDCRRWKSAVTELASFVLLVVHGVESVVGGSRQ
ncbi:transducin/WD40 repeat-like superfamily protein [Striga asiatica]|uniref:Transducin/WD40 repeat-like superfamily protein n=1 Tax=Striga asiatica TaxID=4170 RepID=A0A5A7PYG9_STRAF|nr:transducin/WD40 repeat-like superfamily protein [Striga asiatica]